MSQQSYPSQKELRDQAEALARQAAAGEKFLLEAEAGRTWGEDDVPWLARDIFMRLVVESRPMLGVVSPQIHNEFIGMAIVALDAARAFEEARLSTAARAEDAPDEPIVPGPGEGEVPTP